MSLKSISLGEYYKGKYDFDPCRKVFEPSYQKQLEAIAKQRTESVGIDSSFNELTKEENNNKTILLLEDLC